LNPTIEKGAFPPNDIQTYVDGCKGADEGMFGAGAASSPLDVNRSVQSATAAALRAIKVIHQTARTEKV